MEKLMAGKEYALQEFYRYLKLDIWRQGQVRGWGRIEEVRIPKGAAGEKIDFHTKPLNAYRASSLIRKQLASGIYLLGLIPVRKDETAGETIQLAIIAVCRNVMDKTEAIHCLKITGKAGFDEIRQAMLTGQAPPQKRRHKSPYRKKPSRAVFDNAPVNSYTRKH